MVYKHETLTLELAKSKPSLARRKKMTAEYVAAISGYPSDVQQKKMVHKFFAFDNPHFRKQATGHIPKR
jgi:hypothetical protein